jgi:hypothetical protein
LNNGLTAAVDALLSRLAHTIQHHPKHVTALVAALMLGGGGGAYAVASLAPDAADLPVREVVEAVEPLPLQAQADLLDAHSFKLFRSDITRSTDTAEALLQRLGINDAAAAGFLRNDAHFRNALLGRAGRTVTAEASDSNELLRLSARWAPEDDGQFTRLVIEKNAARPGFAA